MKEIKRQLPIAPQKPIVTPGSIRTVSPTIAAFTIKVKRPKVKNINGNAKIVTIGFTTVLTSEKISPAAK